ncbi:zinc finger MYM-type protein 6, partial [Trichonephila inaurata madagascariensis]
MSSETFDRGSEDSSHVCFHAIPYSLLRNGEPLSLIKHGAMVPSSHQKHEHGMATPFIPTAEEGSLVERIEEIAEDIESQLFERINASPWYALQVDESTDIDNKAILLAYVRYLYQEDVHEDLLCALPLQTNTTGAEMFKSLDGYISRQLKWSFCEGICTDGAAAMTGRLSSLTARIKEVAPEKKKSPLGAHFSDEVWVTKLAYLCDIFNLLNELNLCLQGEMKTVFKLADKVAAFKAKLELWGRRVNRGIFDMFHTLAGILGETEPEHSFSQLVHDHLSLILKEFERYFPTTKDPQT